MKQEPPAELAETVAAFRGPQAPEPESSSFPDQELSSHSPCLCLCQSVYLSGPHISAVLCVSSWLFFLDWLLLPPCPWRGLRPLSAQASCATQPSSSLQIPNF